MNAFFGSNFQPDFMDFGNWNNLTYKDTIDGITNLGNNSPHTSLDNPCEW